MSIWLSLLPIACHREPLATLSCAVQPENALRLDCSVTLEAPSEVELHVTPLGGSDEQKLILSPAAVEHHLTVERLTPETRYHLSAALVGTDTVVTGEWSTGSLPPEFPQTEVTGLSTSSDDRLFLMPCAGPYAFVTDADGTLVWYQDLAAGLDGFHIARALSLADGVITALLDQALIRRFSMRGELLFELDLREIGLDRSVHHDLVVKDDLLYVLFADVYGFDDALYILDGLYVVDTLTKTHVATWELADHVVPEGQHGRNGYWDFRFPYGDDWSHANGLFVDDALGVWISWYQLDAVTRIDGAPASPDFGSITLAINGDARSPFPAESPLPEGGPVLTLSDPDDWTDDETFSYAHHPNLTDGLLTLFDNEQGGMSRVLLLRLDEAAHDAQIVGSLDVGAHCPIEGSVYPLDNGHWLATCSTERAQIEIDPVTSALVQTTRLSCGTTEQGLVPRTLPVRW